MAAFGGATQTFGGFTARVSDLKFSPTAASASITLNSDGTVSVTGNASSAGSGVWYGGAPAGGIGSSYWVKFVLSSGDAWTSGAAAGAVVSLSAGQTITWSIPPSTPRVLGASVAVSIYSDSGGVNLVGTGSIIADVEES